MKRKKRQKAEKSWLTLASDERMKFRVEEAEKFLVGREGGGGRDKKKFPKAAERDMSREGGRGEWKVFPSMSQSSINS